MVSLMGDQERETKAECSCGRAYFHAPGCTALLEPHSFRELLPRANPPSIFEMTATRIAVQRDRLIDAAVAAWSIPYGSREAFLAKFDVVIESHASDAEWSLVARPIPVDEPLCVTESDHLSVQRYRLGHRLQEGRQ
jgi:hypothetical protein